MDNWHIRENSIDIDQQRARETVFTIGNGYLGTRGSFEEGYPGDQPMTLVHGVFDDVPIVKTELANAPNWLDFQIFANGERFRMERGQVLSYERDLDLRSGALARKVRWQSPDGVTLDLEFERFASLADEHVLGIRCRVTSLDFAGELEFRASVPGHMNNRGFVHWEWVDQGQASDRHEPGARSAYLLLETRDSKIQVCEAFQLAVPGVEGVEYDYWDSLWNPTLVARLSLKPGDAVTAEKLVTIYTSRDTSRPREACLDRLNAAASGGYAQLRAASDEAWSQDWEACNITIQGDDEADRALRFSLFGLLIAAPRNDERVSIAAKCLSGFGYRGHVFWDTEIFILPFFTFTRPHIARNLLMYRYHTLAGARRIAQEAGFEGAMFAWESAATGEETTPRWVPGLDGKDLVRIWCGDIEHHITADVVYAVQQYWLISGDDDFMRESGAEIVLDAARFWGSRAEWNAEAGQYELNYVIGPDEYHDRIDNNAFTNALARWCLQTALADLDWLRSAAPAEAAQLEQKLDLTAARLAHWREVIEKMYLGYDPQRELYEQFEGFFQRKDIDLQDYEPRTKSMQVILGIEGVQEYQVLKQPDVLMLMYLLQSQFSLETLRKNWDYYAPRTDLSYGSSLGPSIMAILSTKLGQVGTAYRYFDLAARTDLEDARGNTAEGFHAATAGGLWQAVVFGFGGLQVGPQGPFASPRLPSHWTRMQFRIQYHGEAFHFDLAPAAQGQDPTPAAPVQPVTGNSPVDALRGFAEKTEPAPGQPELPILGAIFDLDGVLTDTSELHYQGWQRLADEEGLPFDRQANEALRGVSRRDSFLLILQGRPVPEEKLLQMMERKNQYYLDSVASLTPENLLPGARELLAELRAAGVKTAIGSASKNARLVIEKLGIAPLVDAIADGNSVEQQKPAPDLFLEAARLLGLLPRNCVVFEDAEAGVNAARAGGMWAVGLGPLERVGAAHVIIPSLRDMHWNDLLASFARVHTPEDILRDQEKLL